MLDLIQPFVLLKRTHVKVRILHDGAPVPGDAAAVVIPGFSPTAAGRERVRSYLEAGGTVDQSLQNDFAPAIALGAPEDLADARRLARAGSGRASSDSLPHRAVAPGATRRAPATASTCSGLLSRRPVEPGTWSFGEPLFARSRVGKGRFFYLGADLEAGLLARYDPWREDRSHLFYEALLPEAEVDLDNPAVELAHKARGDDELLVLANHSESWQDVTVSSRRVLRLEDAETGGTLGEGTQIPLRLSAAQVIFARGRPTGGQAPSLR